MANCKITEDEARNRIMRQLKYAPDKKGGSGRKPKSNVVGTVPRSDHGDDCGDDDDDIGINDLYDEITVHPCPDADLPLDQEESDLEDSDQEVGKETDVDDSDDGSIKL